MTMTRTITTYERITQRGYKSLPCPVCGKRVKRQFTFVQTINPYNRAADGSPKTRAQIEAELDITVQSWRRVPETCAEHA